MVDNLSKLNDLMENGNFAKAEIYYLIYYKGNLKITT